MITIVRAVQTSLACPAQWDLWDADGNYYYARFRSGYGSLTQYQDENWTEAPWKPDEEIDKTVPGWGRRANTAFIADIAGFEHGDDLAGSISLEGFAELAGITLAPECWREGFGDYVRDQLIADGIIPQEGSELDGIITKWNEVSE